MENFVDLNKNSDDLGKIRNGIIFDTNIWVFLQSASLATNNGGYRIKQYMNAYSTLLKNNVNIYTTDFIISEFINTSIRLSMKQYKISIGKSNKAYSYKNDYCKTNDFEKNYDAIIGIARDEIWGTTKHIRVSKSNLERCLTQPSNDFNDQIIINEATDNNLSVLTDDADYIKYTIFNTKLKVYSFNSLITN